MRANSAGEELDRAHRTLDAERKRNSELVAEKLRLEQELAQVKIELKLERQNKFATNAQKNSDSANSESASDEAASPSANDSPVTDTKKTRGAPVGHPGWFRQTPTEYDWLVEVPAPATCPNCNGHVTAVPGLDPVDHLQEDIIDNVYRVVCYRHEAARCDDCGCSVQQAGSDELLDSRIGPYLRSRAIWLRNAIGISYRKIARIIKEMHGITFTPTALIGFEIMLAEKSKPVVDDIRKKLSSSDGAVHADETYWITDAERSYFWVHCSHNFVNFQYDTSRAGEVSRDVLGDDFLGTLVTDCYGGYSASAAGANKNASPIWRGPHATGRS